MPERAGAKPALVLLGESVLQKTGQGKSFRAKKMSTLAASLPFTWTSSSGRERTAWYAPCPIK